MKPEYIQISDDDITRLKKEDYQMDVWLSGKLLSYNDKYDAATMAKRTNSPLAKNVLLAIAEEDSK